MFYKISNNNLTVTISKKGAEVVSINKNGFEYLHDGINYWQGIAPIMFPICGRLFGGKYTYKNNEYEMILHGFVRHEEMSVFNATTDSITFIYSSTEESKKQYPFDFVIASSHLVNGIDPYYPVYKDKFPGTSGYHAYFQSIIENIKSFQDFDIYGHLDYVCRYIQVPYIPSDFKDLIDEILRKIIELGKGIEVNTAGLAKGLSFPHPHPFILKRYLELGGEIITIGSDAHTAPNIGAFFSKTEKHLLSLGYKYYTTFKDRKPYFHKLDSNS